MLCFTTTIVHPNENIAKLARKKYDAVVMNEIKTKSINVISTAGIQTIYVENKNNNTIEF